MRNPQRNHLNTANVRQNQRSLEAALMQQRQSLPKPLEPDFYRATYPSLSALSDAEVERHYREIGIPKGLFGSPGAARHNFIRFVQNEPSVLEIGPWHAPTVVGDHVKYMDAFGTDDLVQRAIAHGLDPGGVPQIDYISPTGTFEMVTRKFHAAFSSHSIEHQPDFVRHLRNISSVLEAEGRYYIICPDKRYCFDHFRPETTIADIVTAYLLEDKNNQPRSFASQMLLMTHNDAQTHWSGDHGLPAFKDSRGLRLREIQDHIERTDYIDCHAWEFTPQVFFEIVSTVSALGLTDLYPERVYHTPAGALEFAAVLRKTRHSMDMSQVFRAGDNVEMQLASGATQIKALTEEIAQLQKQLHHVYSSRSWRVTRPLRTIFGMLNS